MDFAERKGKSKCVGPTHYNQGAALFRQGHIAGGGGGAGSRARPRWGGGEPAGRKREKGFLYTGLRAQITMLVCLLCLFTQ